MNSFRSDPASAGKEKRIGCAKKRRKNPMRVVVNHYSFFVPHTSKTNPLTQNTVDIGRQMEKETRSYLFQTHTF